MTMTSSLRALPLAIAIAATTATTIPTTALADSGNPWPFIAGAIVGGAIVSGAQAQQPRRYVPVEPYDQRRPERAVRYVDAGRCALDLRTRDGYQTVYLRNCLIHSGFRHVPDRCTFGVRYRGDIRPVVTRRCLWESGYRIHD